MEGMEFLKRGNNQCAIENFDMALKFDKNNEKIYIAKGCALANMVGEERYCRTTFQKD
jgi:hypothetical protein